MINYEWVQHRSGVHQMFPSSLAIKDDDGNHLVTSYAVHRPDGNWSLMVVNRDESTPHSIRVVFDHTTNHPPATRNQAFFSGPVSVVSFGSQQYKWIEDGPNSHPDPDNFPRGSSVIANADTVFVLPKASITVLRGRIH